MAAQIARSEAQRNEAGSEARADGRSLPKHRADSPGATISAPAPRALSADLCPGGLVAIDVQWEDRAFER